jgi:hypothetical protein
MYTHILELERSIIVPGNYIIKNHINNYNLKLFVIIHYEKRNNYKYYKLRTCNNSTFNSQITDVQNVFTRHNMENSSIVIDFILKSKWPHVKLINYIKCVLGRELSWMYEISLVSSIIPLAFSMCLKPSVIAQLDRRNRNRKVVGSRSQSCNTAMWRLVHSACENSPGSGGIWWIETAPSQA